MVLRENRRSSSLPDKFQLLPSLTISHAENETLILLDASKYIKTLNQEIEKINNETTSEQSFVDSTDPNPMVTVETLEKGFIIKVIAEKNESSMLVCVLVAFEDLGLDVVEARVSCTDTFRLHAICSSHNDDGESIDVEVVKEAVAKAIRFESDSYDPKC